MKKCKKILQMLFFTFAFVMTLSCVSNVKAEAAAKKLKANKWYKGSVGIHEKNEYTYVMPKSGYFYLQVIATDGTGIRTAYVEIVNNYKRLETLDPSYGDGAHNSCCYSFKKGTKIQFFFSPYGACSVSYKFRIVLEKPKRFETENNDTQKKADSIKRNLTYTGLMMQGDSDWFVFKAPKTKTYKISAVTTSLYSSDYFYICVYDGYRLISRECVQGGSGWITAYKGKLKKGQKIYIHAPHCVGYNYFYKLKVK